MFGTPPVRALFFEFPDEPELFAVDRQFLVGSDILVTPVLTPNAKTVDGKCNHHIRKFAIHFWIGIFPGRGSVVWRDWYTHNVVDAPAGSNTTLSAPLGHINIHVRDGSAILLHAKPAYTIEETRRGPYSLLVSLTPDGHAFGSAYIDDGESDPPGPSKTVMFTAKEGKLRIKSDGSFHVRQLVKDITLLGVEKPKEVLIPGQKVANWQYMEAQRKLVMNGVDVDLNKGATLVWA
jgi:alpha-glucosidase